MTKIFYKEENILDVKEEDLIQFFLERFGDSFYRNLRIPFSYKPHIGVKEPFLERGDLDLLLIDPSKPQFTYEFEVKRIKIKYDRTLEESITKLNTLKKAVSQLDKRLELGFHKNYLVIIIVFYGDKKPSNNVFFKIPAARTLDKIYNSDHLNHLDERVGIIGLEISQMTSKNFNEQAGMGIYIKKDALPLIQSLSLTEKIAKIYSK